jgi:hypothetical protein
MAIKTYIKVKERNKKPYGDCADCYILEQNENDYRRGEDGFQMYCPSCGFELDENACMKPICPECGTGLRTVCWKKGDRW